MNGKASRAPNRSGPAVARRVAAGAERAGLSLAIALSLSACAETGDFGRPRPSLWNDAVLPATGSLAAHLRDEPVSFFDLTDDERELRQRAWRFLTPAHERAWFDRALAELVRTRVLPATLRPADPAAYHDALTSQAARSPVSRYRRLGEDVAADRALLAPFAARAARVLAMDRTRLRAVPFMREADAQRIRFAVARVAENRCLVAWVRQALDERIAAYAEALEGLFLETPDAQAIPPERALAELRAAAGILAALPVPPFADGGCIGAETVLAEAVSVAPVASPVRTISK